MGEEHSDDPVEGGNDRKIDGDPSVAGAADEPAAAGEAASEESAGDALAAARSEVDALKDQLLRSQAEAENVRRRAARDVENAHKFALEKFAADLLPVIDSLEKAVESTEAAAAQAEDGPTAGPSEELGAIGEGVALSLKLFHDVLERFGISRIDPVGEPFDPKLHEAMAMVENPDAEPNSVLEVMQRGYLLNGRLVRAAMVVVSKGPAGSGG